MCKLLQRVSLVERPLKEVLGQLFIVQKCEKAVCGNTFYLEDSDDETVQSGDPVFDVRYTVSRTMSINHG